MAGQPKRPVTRAWRGRAGFSLVELLTVILILLILMAVALPLYLDTLEESELQICRVNMRTLASVAQSYRLLSPSRSYTSDLNELALRGDLPDVPTCPSGGGYRIRLGPAITVDGKRVPPGGFAVEDFVFREHGSYVPGLDGQ